MAPLKKDLLYRLHSFDLDRPLSIIFKTAVHTEFKCKPHVFEVLRVSANLREICLWDKLGKLVDEHLLALLCEPFGSYFSACL
jgi:hypothetical protein